MKTITIAGRLGRDAVLRDGPKDKPVLNFAVAVNDGYGDKKSTLWFDCALWGDRGSKLAQYLTKATQVCVSGELGKREHNGTTYLTVRVSELTLMGGGEDHARRDDSASDYRAAKNGGGQPANFGADLSDEIPFAPEWR